MKASELVAQLEALIALEGDCEVVLTYADIGSTDEAWPLTRLRPAPRCRREDVGSYVSAFEPAAYHNGDYGPLQTVFVLSE